MRLFSRLKSTALHRRTRGAGAQKAKPTLLVGFGLTNMS